MDTAFGLVGDGFVLLATDCEAARSILSYKHDEDKIMELDSSKLLANCGTYADRTNFTEYIQKNIVLYELNNGLQLTTHAAANYIRGQLAQALRSKGAYQCNMLLGGCYKEEGPALYWMDYMACMHKMNFGSHGMAASFCLSIFDREWKPNMSLEEALKLIQMCVDELKVRFLINQATFKIKVVDKDGIRVLDDMHPSQ